jgi:ABC-type phosphate transport system substrate-binding protein
MFPADQQASAATYVTIDGSGSTWSANAIDDWATNIAQYGITVNYTGNGSTSGRQQFASGAATRTCRTRPAARRSCTT